ncbi:MAG: PIN domain-containing protein [Pacificimonas sp.]
MSILLDTNVVIHIRDGDVSITRRFAALDAVPAVSVLTLIELEGGAASDPLRRARLDALLPAFRVLPLLPEHVDIYRRIITQARFARRKIIDRAIAAMALAANMRLATTNMRDFEDIDGLRLDDWSPLK